MLQLPYKLWLLSSLYLAQGLPFGFFTQALPVLLRDQGWSLKAISLTGFLYLPWALKFAWAPWLDNDATRRKALLWLQITAVAVALGVAAIDFEQRLWLVLIGLLAFNLIAATQDVATDGLGVTLLNLRERGLGNGIQVGAYRLGMVIGGGALLWLLAKTDWSWTFIAMAGLLTLTIPPVLGLKFVQPHRSPAKTQVLRPPLTGWWHRLRQPGFISLAALIILYKLGDSMGASVVGPYMRDSGLSKEQIAIIKGALSSAVTLLGAAAGGWLAWRHGRRTAVLWGGVLQAASLIPYALSAAGIGGYAMIVTGAIAEHLFGGMALVALFALMMDACAAEHAGTDYTLLSCALVLGQGVASFLGAALADALGYAVLYTASIVIAGIGCGVLIRVLDSSGGPLGIQGIWRRA